MAKTLKVVTEKTKLSRENVYTLNHFRKIKTTFLESLIEEEISINLKELPPIEFSSLPQISNYLPEINLEIA